MAAQAHVERGRRYDQAHPDSRWRAHLKRTYGALAIDWYRVKFEEQGGRCGICRRTQEQAATRLHPRLMIDHDHDYDAKDRRGWRSLLCHNCNVALGLFGERITTTERALELLRAWTINGSRRLVVTFPDVTSRAQFLARLGALEGNTISGETLMACAS